MTPEVRADLLRLCKEAQGPGPWNSGRFIHAMCDAVPDLLAENERLRKALRRSDLIMERYVDEMVAGDDLRSVRKAVVEALAETPADEPTRERKP